MLELWGIRLQKIRIAVYTKHPMEVKVGNKFFILTAHQELPIWLWILKIQKSCLLLCMIIKGHRIILLLADQAQVYSQVKMRGLHGEKLVTKMGYLKEILEELE